jgi:hypothetical protein
MSIHKALNYADESDFVQRLLIPVLERLGFERVTNYHGAREFGKDLVFGETDKFGHHVYHGLQAKYVASISQSEAHYLVRDAEEAFAMAFRHPTKGTEERISTFHVVNGGSIADNAKDFFYARLIPKFGPNVRLFDGSEVVALERRALLKHGETIKNLSILLRELALNRANMILLAEAIRTGTSLPSKRLRDDCSCAYIGSPTFDDEIDVYKVTEYSDTIRRINDCLMTCEFRESSNPQVRIIHQEVLRITSFNVDLGDEIERFIRGIIEQFAPLIDI